MRLSQYLTCVLLGLGVGLPRPCDAAMSRDQVLSGLASRIEADSFKQYEVDRDGEIDDTTAPPRWIHSQTLVYLDREKQRFRVDNHLWLLSKSGAATKPAMSQDSEYIWTPEAGYQYTLPAGVHENGFIIESDKASERASLDRLRDGYCFQGRPSGDKDDIVTILKRGNASMRQDQEVFGGSRCFVLTCKGPDGSYEVWVDGDRGFIPVRIFCTKQGADNYLGHPLNKPMDIAPGVKVTLSKWELAVTASKLEKIGAPGRLPLAPRCSPTHLIAGES